jgi:hypothetical protein
MLEPFALGRPMVSTRSGFEGVETTMASTC